MVYYIFFDISMAALIVFVILIGFKAIKPKLRVEEFKDAYYVAKLKEHASKNKINLDEEIKAIFRSEKGFLDMGNPAEESKSYVDGVDDAFSEKKK